MITRAMLSAAHSVVLDNDLVLGYRLLERIYTAMKGADPEYAELRQQIEDMREFLTQEGGE